MSDSTVSVSKGVFVFKNGFKPQSAKTKRNKRNSTKNFKSISENTLWYKSYSKLWNKLEDKIKALNEETFSSVLSNLVKFIKNSYETPVSEIPTATLLTGINMPDHTALFRSLTNEIEKHVSPHSAILHAEDCNSLKNMIENMIGQFVNAEIFSGDDSSDSDEKSKTRIKKSHCTFSLLQSWYETNCLIESPKKTKQSPKKRKMLVVIIPDFESFNNKILQEFVLIISSYLNILPFALVFGVATSTSALHKSLPYHVSSKISVQVFQSQTSVMYLNNILENIFLTADCPFHLGGRIFSLFIDQFLFYDLSVKDFIRNVKYSMLEHYSYGNAMALCTGQKHLESVLNEFTHDDFENVRRLTSFRSLVEDEQPENRIKLLTNDSFLKDVLHQEIITFIEYLGTFHLFLKCLHILVQDMPNNPLGKQLRELYRISVNELITSTDEFRQSFQLLGFQSKDELLIKLTKVANLIKSEGNDSIGIKKVIKTLNGFVKQMENFNSNEKMDDSSDEGNEDVVVIAEAKNRKELREKLLKMTHESKPINRYEKMRNELLTFLTQTFEKYLDSPKELPFHEIFIFDDISIKKNIEGIQRASLHEALVNPHTYLQCQCCILPHDSSVLKTMPDVCILYKLHLECGKLINLYDLLQSFLAIVEPDNVEDCKIIKPELQARFTQAVAELEYLGFIKSSKRKTDHVSRLTWSV